MGLGILSDDTRAQSVLVDIMHGKKENNSP